MLLEDLTNELAAACAEKSLPRSLSPAQVWVQADGRAQLADFSLAVGEKDESRISVEGDDRARCTYCGR